MNINRYLDIFAKEYENRALPLIPVDTGATKNTTRHVLENGNIVFINDPIGKSGKPYAIYPYYNHKSKDRWFEKVNSDSVLDDWLDYVLNKELK
jgi:hypothetical protein